MKQIQNFRIPYSKNPDLKQLVSEAFNLRKEDIKDLRVLKRSLDARAKPRLYWVYSLELFFEGDTSQNCFEAFPKVNYKGEPPLIIGAGPAGLFAAYTFLEHGIKPILFERGERTHARMLKISRYWRQGILDADSNVCNGEGGAGTFSDGKLITRIKSPLIPRIMNTLVSYGAPKEIEYVYNPHVGSNLIREVIKIMSDDLISRGAELRFNTRVESLDLHQQEVQGVHLSSGENVKGSALVLACGHSATSFFETLYEQGVKIEAKPFALGLRIEHLQKEINQWQYGQSAESLDLDSAQYKLSHYWDNEKVGVYSFCMCPGGYVLSSTTDAETIVVNGMSNYHRNSPWANSAIVCSIDTDKIEGDHPFKMLRFQREIESKVYQASLKSGNGRQIPAQRLEDFLQGRLGKLNQKSSSPSGVVASDLSQLLPKFVNDYLREGLMAFEKQRRGFYSPEALLHAVESRTSSPIRIPRDENTLESVNTKGLYPCGEGPGYAGGITSAAVDGMKAALAWIKKNC